MAMPFRVFRSPSLENSRLTDVQGVIVMRIDDGNQVVSLERVEKMDEEETGEQA